MVISEVMLQQTQVERVVPYFHDWLQRWPDFASLAAASPAEVIAQWSGLGYNRRALNLHRMATVVWSDYGGHLPQDPDELETLPGVGPYTASAVASFAFEQRVAVLDTNIGRLVARALPGVAGTRGATRREVATAADALLPKRGVRDHNLALMDLGAMVCTARAPACGRCPVAGICEWRAKGYPSTEQPATRGERFEDTARFARGRIIEALRHTSALTTAELSGSLPDAHADRVGTYLAALEREGMVEQDAHGAYQLPTGRSNGPE